MVEAQLSMTHYETLGVNKKSSTDEIKSAYKKLAKKFHPDINPNNPSAEAKFKEISNAYNILSDENKRRQYDAELEGIRINYGPGIYGQSPFGADFFSNFNDLFDPFDLLQNRGQNINVIVKIRIGFLDAREQHVRSLRYNRKNICKICNGSGAKSFNGKCVNCHGNGTLRSAAFGLFSHVQICSHCNGQGKQIREKCLNCQKGQVEESIEVNVTIPAGIMQGKNLRLIGEGHRITNGKGDLIIQVEIQEDPRWERHGAHVVSKLAVPYPTLVLGGEMELETIWGKEKINIMPGSKANSTIPLYGKGFPVLHGIMENERGVHNVILDLLVPRNVTNPRYLELLRELKKLHES